MRDLKRESVEVLKDIQEQSKLAVTLWSLKIRILVGDWLTLANFWAACRDHQDNINKMEQLEYGEENSTLWHHTLQASHMIMHVHYGHAIQDPTSLAAHKGLLNHTWDVSKPNYATAKALIRHPLIARLLCCVMSVFGLLDLNAKLVRATRLAA